MKQAIASSVVFSLKFVPKSRMGNTHTNTHLCGLTDIYSHQEKQAC